MTRVSVVSVKMTVKKRTDTGGDAGLFYLLFCTVYCNENRLKNNMTPENLFRDRPFDFLFGESGGGGFLKIFSDRKTETFFSHSPRAKIFFSGQSKNIFFF